MKGTMEWEGKGEKEEIVDSQMEKEGTIQTVNSNEYLEKWLRQGHNNTLKVNWRPTVGSPARETDTGMKQANKAMEGLTESKYATKELSEEVEWMARKIGLERIK